MTVVGILSPGEMGASLAKSLRRSGMQVITSLQGRSELTRLRARETDLRDAGSLDAMVQEADLVISVLTPSEAVGVAEQIADGVRRTGAKPVFVDSNAIAPQTVRAMSEAFTSMG